MFVNEIYVYKLLRMVEKNSGLRLIEIEFDNGKISNPKRFSMSDFLSLHILHESCE